ncbi:hypothetical protein AGRA3207_004901 [Actinomadura graeca]|uniref:Fibronectin attachment protein n=1 Tax=Actinomadura graeca TaxID=2750812 RepID=A0ABX8R162_9ACTN|nr:hypothetical protein [Actinomadura graeca]QXJ23707.1 hypothetical protein AGRA3207_004901 [Actinomadura graeca]
MSGPEDTRESAAEAGAQAVPSTPAPPSFGGSGPPAEAPPEDAAPAAAGAEPASPAALTLPPFGLQTPWWAAESQEAAPEPAPAAETAEPEAVEPAPEVGEPAAEAAVAAEPAPDASPGTLVAGIGVPKVDSRRAVPAEPIVKGAATDLTDTDPEGIPAVQDEIPPVPGPEPQPEPEAPAAAVPDPDEPEPPARPSPADKRPPAFERVAEADGPKPPPPPAERPVPGEGTTTPHRPVRPAATWVSERPSAFEKAKEAEKIKAPLAPVLVPDAILPPGVVPPTGSGPHPKTGQNGAQQPAMAAVITPVYHAEGISLDAPSAPSAKKPAPKAAPSGKRRPMMIGGGAAAVLAAVVALFTLGGTGAGDDAKGGSAQPPVKSSAPVPAPPAPAPVDITDEKNDTKGLEFTEVFPEGTIRLGGRTYVRDRWSINKDPAYAANGAMLAVLRRENCRKVVRATYLDRDRKLAVTSGIAVMPTKAAALKVGKAGNPAKYEWFRGMPGKRATDIDRAGGYAAATVRGRYVVYAYVQWADGRSARPGDPMIKQVAQQFLDYDARPIEARARG